MPENKRLLEFWKNETEKSKVEQQRLQNRIKILENRLLYLNDEEVREGKGRKNVDLKMWIGFYVFLLFMTIGTIASALIVMWLVTDVL